MTPAVDTHDISVAAGGLLGRLDTIVERLDDLLLNSEQEPDFDQTFVVGGQPAAAIVLPIYLPRTIRHVEITLSCMLSTTAYIVGLFAGNVTATQAANQHNFSGSSPAASNAICTSNGGAVTARDYLDGSGILSVYFSGSASVAYANVRVRSLDAEQTRPQRT